MPQRQPRVRVYFEQAVVAEEPVVQQRNMALAKTQATPGINQSVHNHRIRNRIVYMVSHRIVHVK